MKKADILKSTSAVKIKISWSPLPFTLLRHLPDIAKTAVLASVGEEPLLQVTVFNYITSQVQNCWSESFFSL
jgi:hypothetical protein